MLVRAAGTGDSPHTVSISASTDTARLRFITNMANTWSDYHNPFYDQGWQYTTPYSIYTTGMAWRKDKVNLAPSWDMP